MQVGSWACLLISIFLISFAYCYVFTYSRRRDTAPSVLGLPLVGSTISLAVQGAGFVHACRKRVSKNALVLVISEYNECVQAKSTLIAVWGHCQAVLRRPAHDLSVWSRCHEAILLSTR